MWKVICQTFIKIHLLYATPSNSKLNRAYELHCFDVPPANSFKLVRTTFLHASDFYAEFESQTFR